MHLYDIWGAVAQADASGFRAINSGLAAGWLDLPMRVATAMGTGLFQMGVSLAMIIAGLKADRLPLRQAGYAGLVAGAFSAVLVQVAKHIWQRPRPLLSLFEVRLVGDPLFVHSFPSGHTMTAFAVCFAWAVFLPRLRWLFYAMAAITGFSRIYLGVHFPLDVVYGALIGGPVGILCSRIVGGKSETQAGEA